MIILKKRCYVCGREIPEARVRMEARQVGFTILTVARRCSHGHVQPCMVEDDTGPGTTLKRPEQEAEA